MKSIAYVHFRNVHGKVPRYQETFVANTALNIVPDKTVMLRFELKNLGDFNYKTDANSFAARGDAFAIVIV